MWYPLKLRPVDKEYIWGREISCNPLGMSIVDNGEFAEAELSDLLDVSREELLGTALSANDCAGSAVIPFKIKFIEANDLLPVQVHTHKRQANSGGPEEGGLNKIWYVISAKPGARLGLGLIQDIDGEKLVKKIGEEAILDCLNYTDLLSGDVIGIPSGLVCAGGKGTSLVEIQAHSNMLYTFYDYNRVDQRGQKMPLSIIKALGATECRQQGRKYNGLGIRLDEMARKVVLAVTQLFAAELYIIDDEVEEETDGSSFSIYTFTEGETIIEYGADFLIARQGETVLIPAALGAYRLKGKFKSLKIFVPDREADILQPLKKAGYSGGEIKKNIGGII